MSNRRHLLQAAVALPLLAAIPSFAQSGRPIKVGFVSPRTGPASAFGEADKFIIDSVTKLMETGIATAQGQRRVELLVRDSQSNPNKAAEVAGALILRDKVDLMLVSATPETVNPVSDQCEANGVPCISTVQPWQSWYFGRGGTPDKGFEWTYHFFWGLEDVISVFTGMWNGVPTNKKVGGLFERSGDGDAWSNKEFGFPPALQKLNYEFTQPSSFQPFSADFTAQIAAFKSAGVDIVAGICLPPDVKTFWSQARQQGFKPKVVSVGKALLFPSALEALGDLGDGLSTEIWFTPTFPTKSSLTGQTAAQLCAAYEATGRQWTQPLGFSHALLEVAVDVLKRAKDPTDRRAIRDALVATQLQSIVGPVQWGKGPVKNVAKTPLVGGQWVRGTKFKYDLVVTNNENAPQIPASAKLKLLA